MMRAKAGVLLACFFVAQTLVGQLSKSTTGGGMFENLTGDNPPLGLAVVQPRGLALESTIDPASYYVGPSDVFSVNIWVSPPVNMTLTVSPEGSLIIPTVGEIHVADLTLAEAKQRILTEIRRKYLTGGSTATLITPRSVVVTVTGIVLNPGSYVLGAYERANIAIELANAPSRQQDGDFAHYFLTSGSRRNVSVRHKDRTVTRVDIPRFHASKDDRWNPYLREGDLVVVPRNNQSKNVIGVYGEVNVPGQIEFVEGDSIKDALVISSGFSRYARTDSVEFSRFDSNGVTITTSSVDVAAILRGARPDQALQPGDRLVVHAKPDQRGDYLVAIEGEVKYPGSYPIAKRSTRLSEVIRRAGGFTEFASLKDAELSRHSVGSREAQMERMESLHGGVPSEDTAYYYQETELRMQKEIVNVDFQRLWVQGDSSQDVVLQAGDYISVPTTRRTVYVFGQTVTPGHIPHVVGEDLEYYIRKAGGYTDRARPGDVKIVKARTKQWLSPDDTIIEEGDYVWVPKEIERSFGYYMGILGQTASVISVGVSIVLLVIQLNKN
jgi:protein involved in polysaccharide export with SLBB domain